MGPIGRFQVQTIRALKAALASAEREVKQFTKLGESALKYGMDETTSRFYLEDAKQRVRSIKNVIASLGEEG
jgi:hypothetical protein